VTDIRVGGDQVIGTATFSSSEKAAEAFQKYCEGHLTDFSAGYLIGTVERVRAGEAVEINGRTWRGPVNVVTQWILKEASCCPIGADEKAKARSYSADEIEPAEEAVEVTPSGDNPDPAEYVRQMRERTLYGTGGDLLTREDLDFCDAIRAPHEEAETPYIRRGWGHTWR
jgi:hypothetical protein